MAVVRDVEHPMQIENYNRLIAALDGDARNAMHSILGFLELISEGSLDVTQREYVEACRAAADRHCRTLEDVRLVLGLMPEEKQIKIRFAPGELFARVAEIIGLAAGRK